MSQKNTQKTSTIGDVTTATTEKERVASRGDRKALIRQSFEYGGPMAIDPSTIEPGFQAQWEHDEVGKIESRLRLGYEFVTDSDGNKISKVVFTRGDKKGLRAYLLQAPQELIDEIEEVRREINEAPLRELEQQHNPDFPTLGLKYLN